MGPEYANPNGPHMVTDRTRMMARRFAAPALL